MIQKFSTGFHLGILAVNEETAQDIGTKYLLGAVKSIRRVCME